MDKLTATGKLAKKYLKKYPSLPVMTIAKLMYSENEMAFTNIDHARSALRRHSGLLGKDSRKNVDPELQRRLKEQVPRCHQEKQLRDKFLLLGCMEEERLRYYFAELGFHLCPRTQAHIPA